MRCDEERACISGIKMLIQLDKGKGYENGSISAGQIPVGNDAMDATDALEPENSFSLVALLPPPGLFSTL